MYNSASGVSPNVEAIKETYSTLQKLHAGLGAANHVRKETEASYLDKELIGLAAICNDKCFRLVKYAGKLVVTRQGKLKRISVTRVVVLIFWLQADVKNLETEINEIQTSMMLFICATTR